MDTLTSMLTLTLIFSSPIIITSLGGLFSERSGVVNIALEGLMMIGGFTAAAVVVFLEAVPGFSIEIGETVYYTAPWVAILLGSLAGGVFALLHAYLSINLMGDQIISGTAINILAGGITVFMAQVIFSQQRTRIFQRGFVKATYKGLSDIPLVGDIFFTNIYPTVFLALFLVLLSWYVLYKLPFGLRLRATGEHPQAVDSLGVSVYKMRYMGVVLSGLFAGLGGGVMVLTQDTQYTIISIGGTGFIALAALIFGKWKPLGLLGASLFFGFSKILSFYSGSIPLLNKFPGEFFYTFPYILTILALVAFSNSAVGPKALGQPYDKGRR